MLKPFIFIIPIENNITTHYLFGSFWRDLFYYLSIPNWWKKQHVSIPPGFLDAFICIWLTFDLSTYQLKSPYACLANKHMHPRIPHGILIGAMPQYIYRYIYIWYNWHINDNWWRLSPFYSIIQIPGHRFDSVEFNGFIQNMNVILLFEYHINIWYVLWWMGEETEGGKGTWFRIQELQVRPFNVRLGSSIKVLTEVTAQACSEQQYIMWFWRIRQNNGWSIEKVSDVVTMKACSNDQQGN